MLREPTGKCADCGSFGVCVYVVKLHKRLCLRCFTKVVN